MSLFIDVLAVLLKEQSFGVEMLAQQTPHREMNQQYVQNPGKLGGYCTGMKSWSKISASVCNCFVR